MDSDQDLEGVGPGEFTFMSDVPSLEEPKVVIALDFGTAFAGFAWALASKPDDVQKCNSWPQMETAGADRYCKAPTCLWYTRGDLPGTLELNDWGYGAQSKYYQALKSRKYFKSNASHAKKAKKKIRTNEPITNWNAAEDSFPTDAGEFVAIEVKMYSHLAHSAGSGAVEESGLLQDLLQDENSGSSSHSGGLHTRVLPKGVTVLRAISDYLKKMGEFAVATVQKSSPELAVITNEDVQWCLAVPGTWTEKAKGEMKACAETAGLVRGPACQEHESASPHEVIIVLEAEAASVYCQQNVSKKADLSIEKGAKIMVVDIGGCTVDVIVHEKMEDLKFKEATPADYDLCGGMFVDQAFFKFLATKVESLAELGREYPSCILDLKKSWENVKHNFGTVTPNSIEDTPFVIEVPDRFGRAWESVDGHRGKGSLHDPLKYAVIRLTRKDLEAIFEPTVQRIFQVIDNKVVPGLEAIVLVGGFSSSPYLQNKIQEMFRDQVKTIISADEPGSAVFSGAITFGTQAGVDIVTSRISRKTYGINIVRPFRSYDPAKLKTVDHNGKFLCKDVFEALVRIGDEVPCNHRIDLALEPWHILQKKTFVGLFSADKESLDLDGCDPMYISDDGVKKEGYFVITHPTREELGVIPLMKLSVCFGQTTIQVTGEGNNFRQGSMFSMPTVSFETTCDPEEVSRASE